MTLEELNQMLENNPQIEWTKDDEDYLYFKHGLLDKEDEKIRVAPDVFFKITAADLLKAVINGRDVDHITRVTGYFSRTSGWNKGKVAELEDRHRVTVN